MRAKVISEQPLDGADRFATINDGVCCVNRRRMLITISTKPAERKDHPLFWEALAPQNVFGSVRMVYTTSRIPVPTS